MLFLRHLIAAHGPRFRMGLYQPHLSAVGLVNHLATTYSVQRSFQVPVHLVKLTTPTPVSQPTVDPTCQPDAYLL